MPPLLPLKTIQYHLTAENVRFSPVPGAIRINPITFIKIKLIPENDISQGNSYTIDILYLLEYIVFIYIFLILNIGSVVGISMKIA